MNKPVEYGYPPCGCTVNINVDEICEKCNHKCGHFSGICRYPNEFKDGANHINVYSKGETELGRWLSNFAHTPIDVPGDGLFESVEGYWYWLKHKDDRLRRLYGWEAKKFGNELSKQQTNIIENHEEFRTKICTAIDIKLDSDQRMRQIFIKSILPLEHYYVFGGVKKDAGYKWILEYLEKRRRELQLT